MKSQLDLIEVPKTGISRAASMRQEVKAFKEANRIWTDRAPIARSEQPWTALYFTPELKAEYKNPVNAIAHYCRILEKRGCLVTGETERDAIRKLCENMGITCNL